MIRFLLCTATVVSVLEASELYKGKLFHIDPKTRTFDLLKETEYDPKSDLTTSRLSCEWKPGARIRQIVEPRSFDGIKGPVWAKLRGLDQKSQASAENGEAFVVRVMTLIERADKDSKPLLAKNEVEGWFTPDDKSGAQSGSILIEGKPVPVRLRHKHWRIWHHAVIPPEELAKGYWQAELKAARKGDNLLVGSIDATPLPDPRENDDPRLPRVLVIGDSISMNYHEAAKAALNGVANYHRIENNAFSTEHGVTNTELWLGDYGQRGLHWDVIQFNHGLHDLKQKFDAETNTWGAYAVPLDAYRKNLAKQIAILRKTGARLIWCSTTPVPNDNPSTYARRKGAAKEFNSAALEVIRNHPDILVTDLHGVVHKSAKFDGWRQGKDVHFYQEAERKVLGEAVAATVRKALETKPKMEALGGQSFAIAGSQAFVILPTNAKLKKPIPWVWYAPTLSRLPGKAEEWMFKKLLGTGIAIAGIDIGESMGNPAGRAKFNTFYREMTGEKGFARKPCLLARSRGGLMLYNWAVENSDSVAGIAGIYPVGNLKSWPGLARAAPAYSLSQGQLAERLVEHNPVDRLAPLAKANVPLFHLHGNNDRVVPLQENSGLLQQRYTGLGGTMTLKLIPGGGHDMKEHWFQSQALIDFITTVLKEGD